MERSCSYDTTLGAISADRGDPLVSADRGESLDVGAPEPMPVPLSLQPPAELVCARWSLAVCVGSGGSEVSVHLAYREGRLTGCRRGAQAAAVLTAPARAGRRPGVRLGHAEHAGEVIAAFAHGSRMARSSGCSRARSAITSYSVIFPSLMMRPMARSSCPTQTCGRVTRQVGAMIRRCT
jgi:hypothetical protein